MGTIPSYLLQHVITIEPYLGQAGDGSPVYGDALEVACFLDAKVRRIRAQAADTSTGDEVLSEATAYAPGPTRTDITADSRVTLPDGTQTRVLQLLRRDGGSLPVPSHLEIVLA
jgi:hypothetical protein